MGIRALRVSRFIDEVASTQSAVPNKVVRRTLVVRQVEYQDRSNCCLPAQRMLAHRPCTLGFSQVNRIALSGARFLIGAGFNSVNVLLSRFNRYCRFLVIAKQRDKFNVYGHNKGYIVDNT